MESKNMTEEKPQEKANGAGKTSNRKSTPVRGVRLDPMQRENRMMDGPMKAMVAATRRDAAHGLGNLRFLSSGGTNGSRQGARESKYAGGLRGNRRVGSMSPSYKELAGLKPKNKGGRPRKKPLPPPPMDTPTKKRLVRKMKPAVVNGGTLNVAQFILHANENPGVPRHFGNRTTGLSPLSVELS